MVVDRLTAVIAFLIGALSLLRQMESDNSRCEFFRIGPAISTGVPLC